MAWTVEELLRTHDFGNKDSLSFIDDCKEDVCEVAVSIMRRMTQDEIDSLVYVLRNSIELEWLIEILESTTWE